MISEFVVVISHHVCSSFLDLWKQTNQLLQIFLSRLFFLTNLKPRDVCKSSQAFAVQCSFTSPARETPLKQLPFSPSQFFNSPSVNDGKVYTSTPARAGPGNGKTPLCTPSKIETCVKTPLNESTRSKSDGELETPRIRYSLINKTPRTPTPLKISEKAVVLNHTLSLVGCMNVFFWMLTLTNGLFSSLLNSTLLFSTLLCSTLLFSALLCSFLLFFALLCSCDSTLLY